MNKEVFKCAEKLSNEYLQCLTSINKKFDIKEDVVNVIDEIRIFWSIHKKDAKFILDYISESDYDTYLFMGASGIEVQSREYKVFILNSKYKIYDDLLPTMLDASQVFNDVSSEIYDEIKYLIKNHIEILSESLTEILIIPINLIIENDRKFVIDLTNKIFLELFDDKFKNIDEYFKNITDEQSFNKNINEGSAKQLILSNNETSPNISAVDKVKMFPIFQYKDISFPEKAYYAFFQAIAQAINILRTSISIRFIPYLRNKVTFNNMSTIMYSLYLNLPKVFETLPHYIHFVLLSRFFYKDVQIEKCKNLNHYFSDLIALEAESFNTDIKEFKFSDYEYLLEKFVND